MPPCAALAKLPPLALAPPAPNSTSCARGKLSPRLPDHTIESGDVEEERRLFYVAVTRAKNELYISYPKVASRAGPGGMMLNPSRFLDELPEDLYEELRIKRSYGW